MEDMRHSGDKSRREKVWRKGMRKHATGRNGMEKGHEKKSHGEKSHGGKMHLRK